jgi:spore germination protein KC
MKREKRIKIYVAILLTIMPGFLSGCWDSHELNTLSIVSGLGWDIDQDTGEVTLTYQSIIPSEIESSSSSNEGGGQKGGNPLRAIQLDQDTGASPYEVLSRYAQHASRIPFYEHTQVYIFGKDGVQRGIYPFLDTQARNPVSRPNALMVVSAEKTASDILGVQDGMENIQAFGMAAEIKLSATFSKFPAVTVLQFQNRLLSKTTAPIAPMVGIFEQTGREGKKTQKIRVVGTAVFKGDRMIGELNERESSGLLWAINEIKIGFVTIPEANLEIVKAKSKIVPELQGDQVKITIEIDQESNLVQYNGHQGITADLVQELEKGQAKEIESQVRAAVEKSFDLEADVFGFGDAVHRKYKKEWKELKPRWDDIYPCIEVVIKAKTHINEIGEINQALIKD